MRQLDFNTLDNVVASDAWKTLTKQALDSIRQMQTEVPQFGIQPHVVLPVFQKEEETQYVLAAAGEQRGPFTLDQVKKLLKMALETINGDFDDDNVSYGIKTLRAHSFRDHMNLFGKSADKGKTDDADSDDEDISTDFIRSLRRKIGIPSFEEFMRMKAQAERSGEKETSDQPTKPASVLSMFARKDEDNEDITIKIGGNEDE